MMMLASGATTTQGKPATAGAAAAPWLDDELSGYLDSAGLLPRARRGLLSGWITASIPLVFLLIVLALLVAFYLFWRIVVIIPPGHVGVLYRLFQGGTQVDVIYPEGIQFIYPYNNMTVYDTRVAVVRHTLDVLTNKGLPIELDLAIRFHPEYELVGLLQQAVGKDYVDKVVIPQVESVLRRDIGQHDPEDIYTNKEGILTAIIKRAIEETSQKYISIDDIIIREVHLPDTIVTAINQKLVYQQQAAAYEYRLAAERAEVTRKQVEAGGIRDYQKIIAETLDDRLLRWQGIKATEEIAKSNNSKVVVVGNGDHGLPIILGGQ